MNYLLFSFLLAFVGFSFANTCNDVNEEYKSCGTACPRTCGDPRTNKICIMVCREGCFCKEPHIRDEVTGKCVLQSNCTHTCTRANEMYSTCGTACPETCANMNEEKRVCTDQCVSGCFCAPGYVRDNNGDCVLKRACPQTYAEEVCADEREVYRTCGTACPTTCRNFRSPHRPLCPAVCVKGCFCKPPYVRDESIKKCVLTSQCPSLTTVNPSIV